MYTTDFYMVVPKSLTLVLLFYNLCIPFSNPLFCPFCFYKLPVALSYYAHICMKVFMSTYRTIYLSTPVIFYLFLSLYVILYLIANLSFFCPLNLYSYCSSSFEKKIKVLQNVRWLNTALFSYFFLNITLLYR